MRDLHLQKLPEIANMYVGFMQELSQQLDIHTLRQILSDVPASKNFSATDDQSLHEYDFSVPHRFSPRQRKKLKDFADQAVRNLSASMSAMLRGMFSFELKGFDEEYANEESEFDKAFYVSLFSDSKPIGFIEYPIATADGLIIKLLGGYSTGVHTEVHDTRKLSSLEQDLLLDMACCMTEAISKASVEHNGCSIDKPAGVAQILPTLFEGAKTAEYTRMHFHHTGAQNEFIFNLVLISDQIESIAGIKTSNMISAEQSRELMTAHINDVMLNVIGRLDQIPVRLRDIAVLAPGDVLMLPKKPSQPIDIIASGKVVMQGLPVTHKNKYSLWVENLID